MGAWAKRGQRKTIGSGAMGRGAREQRHGARNNEGRVRKGQGKGAEGGREGGRGLKSANSVRAWLSRFDRHIPSQRTCDREIFQRDIEN